VGLACACDIAIAADDASFAVSEARSASCRPVIGPYLTNAVGKRQARRLALTAERIGAAEALAIGLVHRWWPSDALDARSTPPWPHCCGRPAGAARDQAALRATAVGPVTPEVIELTAQTISRVRGTTKRAKALPPSWPSGLLPGCAQPMTSCTRPRKARCGAGGRRRHHGRRHRAGGGAGRPHRAAVRLRDGAAVAADQAGHHARRPGGQGQARGRPRRPRWRASSRSRALAASRGGAAWWWKPSSRPGRQAHAAAAAGNRGRAECVLATNTSSISVTAMANGLAQPRRLVGMHFFNPVPLMKLVEVVSGLHTHPDVAEAIFELSLAWGKVPVHARSTPGFIVNRIARPYYAEALALLQEQAATPAGAGRLPARRGLPHGALRADGPDRPRHQLSRSRTRSTRPTSTTSATSLRWCSARWSTAACWAARAAAASTATRRAAGLPVAVHEAPATARRVTVHGGDAAGRTSWNRPPPRRWARRAGDPARVRGSGWTGLAVDGAHLRADRRPHRRRAWAALGLADVAVFDRPLMLPAAPGTALAYAVADTRQRAWRTRPPPGWRHWASRRWRWPTRRAWSSRARWRC
jgi:hypothetical protein